MRLSIYNWQSSFYYRDPGRRPEIQIGECFGRLGSFFSSLGLPYRVAVESIRTERTDNAESKQKLNIGTRRKKRTFLIKLLFKFRCFDLGQAIYFLVICRLSRNIFTTVRGSSPQRRQELIFKAVRGSSPRGRPEIILHESRFALRGARI